MEDLIVLIVQFVFEIFGDLILQVLFEGIFELLSHTLSVSRQVIAPWWFFLIRYILFGGLSGLVSVALVPHVFIHRMAARIAAIIIIPFILGFLFSSIGRVRERFGQARVKLDFFIYAYAFALSMALMRFWLIR